MYLLKLSCLLSLPAIHAMSMHEPRLSTPGLLEAWGLVTDASALANLHAMPCLLYTCLLYAMTMHKPRRFHPRP